MLVCFSQLNTQPSIMIRNVNFLFLFSILNVQNCLIPGSHCMDRYIVLFQGRSWSKFRSEYVGPGQVGNGDNSIYLRDDGFL